MHVNWLDVYEWLPRLWTLFNLYHGGQFSLTFQSFEYESVCWRLFQKRVVSIKLDIYFFSITGLIPLLIPPKHLSSPPVFSEVRVTRSLVLCVCFVDRCLYFFPFSFVHCVVCSSSIDGFWLPLWYLQTLLQIFS